MLENLPVVLGIPRPVVRGSDRALAKPAANHPLVRAVPGDRGDRCACGSGKVGGTISPRTRWLTRWKTLAAAVTCGHRDLAAPVNAATVSNAAASASSWCVGAVSGWGAARSRCGAGALDLRDDRRRARHARRAASSSGGCMRATYNRGAAIVVIVAFARRQAGQGTLARPTVEEFWTRSGASACAMALGRDKGAAGSSGWTSCTSGGDPPQEEFECEEGGPRRWSRR